MSIYVFAKRKDTYPWGEKHWKKKLKKSKKRKRRRKR